MVGRESEAFIGRVGMALARPSGIRFAYSILHVSHERCKCPEMGRGGRWWNGRADGFDGGPFGRGRDCKERSLAPLGVEYKSLGRPSNVAPAFGPDTCLENFVSERGSETAASRPASSSFRFESSTAKPRPRTATAVSD